MMRELVSDDFRMRRTVLLTTVNGRLVPPTATPQADTKTALQKVCIRHKNAPAAAAHGGGPGR